MLTYPSIDPTNEEKQKIRAKKLLRGSLYMIYNKNESKFVEVPLHKINEGSLMNLEENQIVPCDCVLLEGNNCYVERIKFVHCFHLDIQN